MGNNALMLYFDNPQWADLQSCKCGHTPWLAVMQMIKDDAYLEALEGSVKKYIIRQH